MENKKNSALTYQEIYGQPDSFQAILDTLPVIEKTLDETFAEPYDQLIFTTHNTDVLDMPYPKHTFMFLKKGSQDQELPIQIISASDYLKRNTDSLRSAVENDLFGVTPNVDTIFELEEI